MKHAPNMMDISLEELNGLIERLESRRLEEDDYDVVARVVGTLMYLKQVHDDKSMSIKRLLDLLFGSVSSEKTDKLLPRHRRSGRSWQRQRSTSSRYSMSSAVKRPTASFSTTMTPARGCSSS